MKEFDREVTVYVWRFEGPKKPGHAAVKIAGVPGADRDYISWWPSGGAGKASAHEEKRAHRHLQYKTDARAEMSQTTREMIEFNMYSTLRTGQRQYNLGPHPETGVTQWEWGQAASHKIKLPGLGATHLATGETVTYGLDLAKIQEWWTVFKFCPNPLYKYASKYKNCSGVAAAALRAGGADRFASPPTALIYIDPNQVKDWAQRVRAELDRKNRKARDIAAAGGATGEVRWATVTEVMSVRDWKAMSDQNMGLSIVRSEGVKEVDRLLQEYHRYHWTGGLAFTKLRLLGQLMDAVHHYLGEKAGGKRADAVVTLGKQVISTIRAKTQEFPLGNGVQNDQLMWMRREMPQVG